MKTKISRFIECGKVINTHGCHGDVKVEPWTDTPRDIIDLGRVFLGEGDLKREVKILRGSVMQGRFLMLSLEGVEDMNAADALRKNVFLLLFIFTSKKKRYQSYFIISAQNMQ